MPVFGSGIADFSGGVGLDALPGRRRGRRGSHGRGSLRRYLSVESMRGDPKGNVVVYWQAFPRVLIQMKEQ
jgi:hypothetical protein